MRLRPILWILLSVACFVGAVYFWRLGDQWRTEKSAIEKDSQTPAAASQPAAVPPQTSVKPLSTSPMALLPLTLTNGASAATGSTTNTSSRLKYRLSNTTKTVGQLIRQEHAILLANALIDTTRPLNLAIPDSLRAQGDPGAYLVQARGTIDDRFRAELKGAGANIISYFPNNAYLVSASPEVAGQLGALPDVMPPIPYEPYYKLDARLLALAVEQRPLPAGSTLNVVLFPDAREQTLAALEKLNVNVLQESRSPFGPVVTVAPTSDSLTAIAGLPGVQTVGVSSRRALANDLSRPRIGVAMDSVATTNYLNLTGANILVNVVDSGIDAGHPDFGGRVFGTALTDLNGHGTHVAGIIAGDGSQSTTVSNAYGSILPPVAGQFRGMAPAASIYSLDVNGPSDFELQETAARTNSLISNNSWTYSATEYDIAAASYDWAVRDSLPDTTGSQSLVYVFPAGNGGNGTDDGQGVTESSVRSPATAKNVITVGAIEQLRTITNSVDIVLNGITNSSQPWLGMTDSDSEVASFSGRGNVGVNEEGEFGRFKPDLVAPGTFVISTRSSQMDLGAYFDPTYVHTLNFLDQVETNSIDPRRIRISFNAVRLDITASAIYPAVDLPIYLNRSTLAPSVTDAPIGTNYVSLTGAAITPRDSLWTYGIGNPTNQLVRYSVTTDLYTTNDFGNYFEVLSNMNSQLGPYYRYESGTSMAAADVSGVLALMEEYFTNRLGILPSPALLKAMLINGARTANAQYDLQVRKPLNDQGWGLVNLTNSLPATLANSANQGAMLFFDQNPTNAVATGDRRTFNVKIDQGALGRPLRVTLVWTDPPGNPAAGVKLVNDLDLVVTNLDDPKVYYVGNDIPVGSSFNFPAVTNGPPPFDVVNNVENVYISDPVATNYSITVIGHRVNVNAVTAHPDNVVQDYALVVSSGNGETNNALTITAAPALTSVNQPNTTIVTNDFGANTNISGQLLLNQQVGASSPLLGVNTVPLGSNTVFGVGGTNGVITLGETNQWHFYVMTNTTTFTNAAFATFLPPTLSIPRMGVTNYNKPDDATRVQADIDMYVSTDPRLLTLDPTVIANADKSVSRGGTEVVAFTNSVQNRVYYVGIQSPDQQAAEYAFFGVFSKFPFSTTDDNGVETVFGINVPAPIPEGTPKNPGGVTVVGLALQPLGIRRAVVTNTLSHEDMGNLFGALTHNEKTAVLNNHTCVLVPSTLDCYTNYTYIFDDSGEGDIPNSQPTDGPGSLQGFVGDAGEGVWLLTEIDNVGGSTGQVDNISIRLEPQLLTDGSITLNIQPNSFAYTSVLVPPEATNLTICVQNQSTPPLPLELYVRRGAFPTLTDYDYRKLILPPGDCLTISTNDFPPLQAGRYFIGIFNPNNVSQTARVVITMGLGLTGPQPLLYTSGSTMPILDDAVTYSSLFVTNKERIVRAEVGVVIEHPRISDLALTLVSPSGKRILLYENRGGTSTAGLGSATTTTNFFGTTAAGDFQAATNTLSPVPTSGTLVIDYDFLQAPDRLDVYFEGANIFSSGQTSGAGTFSIPYGPGNATSIDIVMNQGDNPQGTIWSYTPRIISQEASYFMFTENTNVAQIPVKFALNAPTALSSTTISDFETSTAGVYTNGATVDTWTVTTNQVSIVNDPGSAKADQFLALANGAISNILSIAPGKKYNLRYSYRGPGIVSWWRGELATNAVDFADGNDGILGSVGFAPGMVGNALNFNRDLDTRIDVGDPANLMLTNSLTIETWAWIDRLPQAANYGEAQMIFRGDTRGFLDPYYLSVQSSGGLRFHLADDSGGLVNFNTSPVPLQQWLHIAATFDGNTGQMRIYTNGVLMAQQTTTIRPFGALSAANGPGVGIGNTQGAVGTASEPFDGKLDEFSVYRRALSASEVKAIYLLGSAGKFDPDPFLTAPQNLAEAEVSLGGVRTDRIFGDNTSWLQGTVNFTAAASSIPLTVTGLEPGMLMDSFVLDELPSEQFVFPEETLKTLEGDDPYGMWRLEVWDNRVGATNPGPQLVSWQLRFILETNLPAVTPLTDGVAVSNSLPPCAIAYYSVQVPTWVNYVTNTLLFATPPGVNVWFNQTNLPAAGGANAGDILLIAPGPSQGGNYTLISSAQNTNTSTPPLIPGARYYLAVENPCGSSTNVDFAFRVDFGIDAIGLTNMVPYPNTDPGTSNAPPQYYSYTVGSDAARVQFEIIAPTGDMTLVARRGLPPPSTIDFDYDSFNPTTNGELIVVFTNSSPVALTPGNWYLSAINISGAPVAYSIMASEWPVTGRPFSITNVAMSSNSFCMGWTSLPFVHYYIEGKQSLSDPNWYKATQTLTASADSMTQCIDLPSPFQFFRVTEGLSLFDVIEPLPTVTATVLTNGVSLNWINSVTARYEVQWTPTLAPPVWNAFTNTITSSNGWFSFLDDGTQTGGFNGTRFYRVRQLLPP